MAVDQTLTRDAAAAAAERFVRTLAPGEPVATIDLMDESGRMLNIGDDPFVGGHQVLVAVRNLEAGPGAQLLRQYVARAEEFEAAGVRVIVISADDDCARNRAAKAALGAPFPVLADVAGSAFAALGLNKCRDQKQGEASARSVLVTPLRQVRAAFDSPGEDDHPGRALDIVRAARAAAEAAWTAPFPPVLAIPGMLDAAECAALIAHYAGAGPVAANKAETRSAAGDYKMPVYEYGRQDRTDHIIRDQSVVAMLDGRLAERVIPQIRRCFAFNATQREMLHIARYEGTRGGMLMGHRDNRTDTAYRRFALSVNLNDDYEGGGVVFREFSSRPVKCAPGTALVFSSALLHEVEETTRGVRYTLISHFFNEASLAEARATGPSRP